MLVEQGPWRVGSLSDDSDSEYRITNTEYGQSTPFDYVHVEQKSIYRVTFHLYRDGDVATTFRDSRKLPNPISGALMELDEA